MIANAVSSLFLAMTFHTAMTAPVRAHTEEGYGRTGVIVLSASVIISLAMGQVIRRFASSIRNRIRGKAAAPAYMVDGYIIPEKLPPNPNLKEPTLKIGFVSQHDPLYRTFCGVSEDFTESGDLDRPKQSARHPMPKISFARMNDALLEALDDQMFLDEADEAPALTLTDDHKTFEGFGTASRVKIGQNHVPNLDLQQVRHGSKQPTIR